MNKKCILPWVHLYSDFKGDVNPCGSACLTTPKLGNIVTNDIIQVWNNSAFQKLRSTMLNDEEPPECKTCYDSERLGSYSKRMRENDQMKDLMPLANSPIADLNIKSLDVRFSTTCNFKCRYCHPSVSSKWEEDYKKLGLDLPNLTNNGEALFNAVINADIIGTVESVYFQGGEPLITDEHLKILQLLDSRQLYSTELNYITNLSTLTYSGVDYIETWKKFKNVNVHISLDAVGKELEYIRHGAVWDDIKRNLEVVFSHKELLKPKISITVSIFNAVNLIQIIETLVSMEHIEYDDISLNFVKFPDMYSVQMLPRTEKEIIEKQVNEFLNTHSLPLFFHNKYEYFIKFMNSNDTYDAQIPLFLKVTKQLDDIRNEDFNITFPEMVKKLKLQ